MKKLLLLLVIAASYPALCLSEVRVGEPAPEFAAIDSNGSQHNLKDLKGKTVVLEWYNHQCPYVKKHYETGNMQKLQKKYTDQGVIWLTVNSSAPGKQGNVDSTKANSLIAEQQAAQSAFLLDPQGVLGHLYGAKTTPHMYVINPDGILVYAGAIDDNSSSRQSTVATAKNFVSSTLDAILNGQQVAASSTQPYGCSVKYAG